MIIYPDKPWSDGQEFELTLEDGTRVVASYKAAKNSWTLKRIVDESKFTALRSAVEGSVNFRTLKQRILDVL